MTDGEKIIELLQSELTNKNREILYSHYHGHTEICCGNKQDYWLDGKGGGCLSCLCVMPVIPHVVWWGGMGCYDEYDDPMYVNPLPFHADCKRMLDKFIRKEPKFNNIMDRINQDYMRYLIYTAFLLDGFIFVNGTIKKK